MAQFDQARITSAQAPKYLAALAAAYLADGRRAVSGNRVPDTERSGLIESLNNVVQAAFSSRTLAWPA